MENNTSAAPTSPTSPPSSDIEHSVYFFGKPNHEETISAAKALKDLPYLYYSKNELSILAGSGIYLKKEKYPYVFVFINDGVQPKSKLLSSLEDIAAWVKRQDRSKFFKPINGINEDIVTNQCSTFECAKLFINSKNDFYNLPINNPK